MIRTTSRSQRIVLSIVLTSVIAIGATGAFATNNQNSITIPGSKYCGCTTSTKAPTTTIAPSTTVATTTTAPSTTTSAPSTTTTAPATSTTTSTTTTVAPTTSKATTTSTSTTTTVAPSTTVLGTVVTAPPTSLPPVQIAGINQTRLPATGSQSLFLALVAISLLGAGIIFVLSQRKNKNAIRMGVDSPLKW